MLADVSAPDLTTKLTKIHAALLQLHAEGRALGEHQVAYHALAGALHAAESLRHVDMLEEVAQVARDHGRWIDENEPQHALSSQSAAVRGHQSIFEQLAAMSAAVRARLKAENLKRK